MKPANILLHEGTAMLSDFGVSKKLKNAYDPASTNVGTPIYISPELYSTNEQNIQSDIWGLGLIMQEILSQKVPLFGSLGNMHEMRMNGQVQKEIDSNLYSKGLIDLIRRMRSVKPEDRPTTNDIIRVSQSASKQPNDGKIQTICLNPSFGPQQEKPYYYRLTVRFLGSSSMGGRYIGIMKADSNISENQTLGLDNDSLSYDGSSGRIYHYGQPIFHNNTYDNDDFVTLEVYVPIFSKMCQVSS
ncbi:MAG: hypothetical protein EZS28_021238 [Streblomastix strix]|uniref:non-specific serine/threonine protein kinase n=1 Tax=Streblomastix strix TaxID=222440 RepID=A0A5J4VL82_9EUKA|nr:MAG: hypothetical protein EZS28_021238 [Streblomastix strix]